MTIDREEFLYHMGLLRDDVKGVKTSVDAQSVRIAQHDTDIALLQEQANASRAASRETRRSFDGILGGVIGAIATAVGEWLLRRAHGS